LVRFKKNNIYRKLKINKMAQKITLNELRRLVKQVINEEGKLTEGKRMYYHIIEYGDYGNIGHQGYYDTEQEAKKRIAELEDMFPDVSFQIFPTNSPKEPPITTV
jgi:hypothetical protein